MPTYQYLCKNCGHELEEFQSINEPSSTHCPECNTESLVRVLGGGAGLIFKGSGFYLTDYKKPSAPPSGSPKAESETKSGTKPDGKTGGEPASSPAPPKSGPPEKKGS